jgi:hypothetical protein
VAISDPATAHFTAHKNLGNTRIAYKPRHTHTHTYPIKHLKPEKPRWQLVTQLLTYHNTQGGPKIYYYYYYYYYYNSLLYKDLEMKIENHNFTYVFMDMILAGSHYVKNTD